MEGLMKKLMVFMVLICTLAPLTIQANAKTVMISGRAPYGMSSKIPNMDPYNLSPQNIDLLRRHLSWSIADNQPREIVEILLEKAAQEPELMQIALRLAARKNRVDIAESVLNKYPNLDLNATNDNGLSALIFAGMNNSVDMIEWLLNHAAQLDQTDIKGMNALHWAIAEGKIDATLALINLGANKELKNLKGYTPIDILNSQAFVQSTYEYDERQEILKNRAIIKKLLGNPSKL
jgi:ankyrin repeat protein